MFPNDEERGQPSVPMRTLLARSSSSVIFAFATTTMNPEILSRQAIRLAQRKSRKAGRPLTREEVLRLHVQTVEP
jgi:hypothetical protein